MPKPSATGYKPPQCKARSRAEGRPQCKRTAIPGGVVCRYHGGASGHVKRAAEERLKDLIDPDRILRSVAEIAYANTQQLFDEEGNLRPVKDWPPQLARAIGAVEVVKRNLHPGDGVTDTVIKVKAWDKVKALEMLMKHLGLLTEKVEHGGALEIRWQSSE